MEKSVFNGLNWMMAGLLKGKWKNAKVKKNHMHSSAGQSTCRHAVCIGIILCGLSSLSSHGAQRSAGELNGSCKNRWKKTVKEFILIWLWRWSGFFCPGCILSSWNHWRCLCLQGKFHIYHSFGACRPEPFPHLTYGSVKRFHVTLLSKRPFSFTAAQIHFTWPHITE